MAMAVTEEGSGADTALVETPAVGPRIRALREAMGLSLRDLADRSGVSAPMLSQVERGETSPTLAVAARIAAGLELTLSQLLRLDEDRHVVIIRRGQGRKRRRSGHRVEEPTSPFIAWTRARSPGAPMIRRSTSREVARRRSSSMVRRPSSSTGSATTF